MSFDRARGREGRRTKAYHGHSRLGNPDGPGNRYATGMAAKKSAKKTPARKAAPKKKAGGKRKAASKSAEAEEKSEEKVSSLSVNLGHLFSLRPRVSKTFRQADFLSARQLLQDEEYANIEEAARAVAEKALDLTHKGPPKRGFKPGR